MKFTKEDALEILTQQTLTAPRISTIVKRKAEIEEHITRIIDENVTVFANEFGCIPVLDIGFDKTQGKPWRFKMVLDLCLFE